MTPTQFAIQVQTLADDALHLRQLSGRTEVSRLYEMLAEVTPIEPNAVEEDLMGVLHNGVRITQSDAEPLLQGIVREIELLPWYGSGHVVYRFTIVPKLWLLTQTRRSRIFQDVSVPEIVKAVIEGHQLLEGDEFELRISAQHPKREYTVQWEETDFAFVSRLLEDEGIFYFFEAGKVVFSDDNEGFRRIAEHEGIDYNAETAATHAVVFGMRRVVRRVQQGVMLIDYNWRAPMLELQETGEVEGGTTGFIASIAEDYRDPDNGARIARLRAEEIACRRVVFHATSTVPTLRAGDTLSLLNVPMSDLDRTYLVTAIEYDIRQHGVDVDTQQVPYANKIEAIPISLPFRPARITPKPRIDGCTYATIDGPDVGAAAPIDNQGRYKVVLHFDIANLGSGRATRWIRMAQPLTGSGYGIHFPLRVGSEVILGYVQGDPDRPIIVGAVPNTVTPSPVVQANATTSMMKTSSGIRIEFEDNA